MMTGTNVARLVQQLRNDSNDEAADLIDELLGARAALALGLGEWQPIDTAPKDGTRILCAFMPDGHVHESRHFYGWCAASGALWTDSPTHWQPLPEPPAS